MSTGKPAATSIHPQEAMLTVSDLISVRKTLADVLAEENGYIDGMRIDKVGEIQERKLKLTQLMERYTQYFTKNPQQWLAMSASEKVQLDTVNLYFDQVMHDNYQKLLVAREVNKAIVNCVTSVLAKSGNNEIYNASGNMYNSNQQMTISMTLNKVI